MDERLKSLSLKERAILASRDRSLEDALIRACDHAIKARERAIGRLGDYQGIRASAIEVRRQCVESLESLVTEFERKVSQGGVKVYRASTGQEAVKYIQDLCQSSNIRSVVKAKTMVGEEIEVSKGLEEIGCKVVETDLGEFIVQLRGEKPSHIIAPALHVSRQAVGKVFSSKLGMPETDDPERLTQFARAFLRDWFVNADMGLIGANMLVARTGDIVTVTNEGNARMCATIPKVLVVLSGIEKVVRNLFDVATLLRVIPRNATGQIATSYVNLIRRPALMEEAFGSKEVHIILVDNGRSKVLCDTQVKDILRCIRCGACMNYCPVFRTIGGHAYGFTYPGPMGIVFENALFGGKKRKEMLDACTLCGECKRVCPVGIDLPQMIVDLRCRTRGFSGRILFGIGNLMLRSPSMMKITSNIVRNISAKRPRLYSKFGQMLGWSEPPTLAQRRFSEIWSDLKSSMPIQSFMRKKGVEEVGILPKMDESQMLSDYDLFIWRFREAGGELIEGKTLTRAVLDTVRASAGKNVAMDGMAAGLGLERALQDVGLTVIRTDDRSLKIDEIKHVRVGVTGCIALVAETGSILLCHGKGTDRVASLLPPTHIVVASARKIVRTLEEALKMRDESMAGAAVLVTGPSRTADIEKTLIIGVHGPKRLILVLGE